MVYSPFNQEDTGLTNTQNTQPCEFHVHESGHNKAYLLFFSQSTDSDNINKNISLFWVSIPSFKYISLVYLTQYHPQWKKDFSFSISNIDEKDFFSVKEQFNIEPLWKIILCYSF